MDTPIKFPSIVGVAKDFAKRAVESNPTYKESEEQIMWAVDYGHDRAWSTGASCTIP